MQCRCIATWTGCVAVTALEGGHTLHTSTQPTLPNSAQVHGGSSQHQGGRVDEPSMVVVVTLQYSRVQYSHICGQVIGYEFGPPDEYLKILRIE